MTNRKKALLGASATIAVWATAFPFSKIALQSVDSLTLSVARVMGGALLMLVIGVVKGLHIPTTWREWGLYILLGATGNFLYQVVFNEGLAHNSSGHIQYYYGLDSDDDSTDGHDYL